MGKAGRIGMLVFAGAMGLAHAAPATLAVIAEIQAALDKGDAQHAADLADGALIDDAGVVERGRLLLYRGLAEELLGKSGEAAADFTRALTTRALPADDRAQALLQRGFLLDGQNRFADAAADYSAVIALKAGSVATALNNRANVYRRQDRLLDARRDYQAALAMAGGRPQYSWYGLGQIAESQNDVLAARGFYAKAVGADPGYALAGERLAALGGPPDGAIADTDAITLRPPSRTRPRIAQADISKPAAGGATEAAQDMDRTIVLRAPSSAVPKAQGETVVLRQPPPRPRRPAAPPKAGVVLRPALDAQPGTARAGGAEVQLGAWRSEAEAQEGWSKARTKAPGLLGALSPNIVVADIPGKGRYWRLRVQPGAEQSRGQFCAALAAQDIACMPARD